MNALSSIGTSSPRGVAAIQTSFAGLAQAGKAKAAQIGTVRRPPPPIITVAQAAAFERNPNRRPYIISDTTANVAAALSRLNGYTKLLEIRTTGANRTLTLSFADYDASGRALSLISTPYRVGVMDTSLERIAGVIQDPHVSKYSVLDTADRIQASLPLMLRLPKLLSVSVSDGKTPVFKVAADDLDQYGEVLSRFKSRYQFEIVSSDVRRALKLSWNKLVKKIDKVTCTSAELNANLAALQWLVARGMLGDIEVQDTYANIQAQRTTLTSLLAARTIREVVVADDLATFQANAQGIAGLLADRVATSAAATGALGDIISNFDALRSLAQNKQITRIIVTDYGKTASMPAEKYVDYLSVINLMEGEFKIEPTSKDFKLNFVDVPGQVPGALDYQSPDFVHALSTAKAILAVNIATKGQFTFGLYVENFKGAQIYGGFSQTPPQAFTFDTYVGALKKSLSGPAAKLDTLPKVNPVPGKDSWYIAPALAIALKLSPAQPNVVLSNLGVGGATYGGMVKTFLHEITEVMGRVGDGQRIYKYNNGAIVTTFDTRNFSDYFSVNGGRSALAYFSSFSGGTNDFTDNPTTASVLTPSDSFNYFSDPRTPATDAPQDLTALDLIQMGALGYKLSARAEQTIATAAANDPYLASALA